MITSLPSLSCAFALRFCLLFVPFSFFISQSFAQFPVFRQDLNEREDTDEREFAQLVATNGKAFVVVRGRELWATYLDANNEDVTMQLGAYDTITNMTVVGNYLYFAARTYEEGNELYRSDGTASGTFLVKDISAGRTNSDPSNLVDVNGTLYFTATNSTYGKEVWMSKGSATSTVVVKDVFPKGGSSNPAHLTNVNGVLYFAANDGTHGYELWKSDGTPGGTFIVKDIRTGYRVSSSPDKLEAVGGILYFSAIESATGRELYKSDGTPEGTLLVKDIRPGTASGSINNLTALGTTLIFTANDGISGDELWKSDGTVAGTALVKDMTPGAAGSHGEQAGQHKMGNFTSIGALVYYTAYDRNTYKIWKTDGTTAGTTSIVSAYGAAYEQPRPNFVLMDGQVYFFNSEYPESWTYLLMKMNPDGTNVRYVYDVYISDTDEAYTPELVVVQDRNGAKHLYYYGIRAFEGYKLLKSTGSEDYDNTIAVPDPYIPTASSNPHDFKRWGTSTYFIANPTWYDNQALWRDDGYRVHELITFGSDGGEYAFTDKNVYASGKHWLELYRAGTSNYSYEYLVDEYGASPAINLTGVKSKMFFTDENARLYAIDDASTQVTFLKEFNKIYGFAPVGSNLIFRSRNAANGEELWRSNGTPSGTIRYATLSSAFQREAMYYPTATIKTNTHYFIANDGVHGNEVWRTQGSGASTYMVADLNPNDHLFVTDAKEADISSIYAFRDSLYISAIDNTGKWALFKTNGTSAGMRKIMNINQVVEMIEAGARLYLFVVDPADATKLNIYYSNGTAESTKFMFQIHSTDYSRAVVLSALYVRPLDGGNSVWRTNGTSCGTFSFDLGVDAGNEISELGATIYFAGRHPDKGVEPYYFDTTPLMTPCTDQQTFAKSEFSAEVISDNNKSVEAYPNPFDNELVISIAGRENEEAIVQVYTPAGDNIADLGKLKCNTSYTIGSSWPVGVYILKVNNAGKHSSQKIVKNR